MTTTLEGKRALVTGGSRGVGLGIVEALVAQGAKVTVLARDPGPLSELSKRLAVDVRTGDVTIEEVARAAIAEVNPDVLILNAGAPPSHGPIDQMTWEAFSVPWETDTKAGFFWIQQALRLPLKPGSRVIVTSSGAAVRGSPMSGGYAGAKRMLWLMAQYANVVSTDRKLDIRFQALVQMQIIDTGVGQVGAKAYAKRKGVSEKEFYTTFGKSLSPREIGDHVVTILTDPKHDNGLAFAVKGDTGITSLDQ